MLTRKAANAEVLKLNTQLTAIIEPTESRRRLRADLQKAREELAAERKAHAAEAKDHLATRNLWLAELGWTIGMALDFMTEDQAALFQVLLKEAK